MTNKQNDNGDQKASKRSLSSALEWRLDVLRKEIASSESGIFPHSILSTQQIAIINTQKPTSIPELEKLIGKLKAEKYGSRIVELIQNYVKVEEPNCKVANEDQGNENERIKRRRKNKSPVIIESSEDEKD